MFLSCIDKISISSTHASLILELIRLLIPKNNNLPLLLNSIKKQNLTRSETKNYVLCKICENELINKKCCENRSCLEYKNIISRQIQIHALNIEAQLSIILKNHHHDMLQFVQSRNKTNLISDVINSRYYKYEENTISLVLFTDATVYSKSGNKSIWAIF